MCVTWRRPPRFSASPLSFPRRRRARRAALAGTEAAEAAAAAARDALSTGAGCKAQGDRPVGRHFERGRGRVSEACMHTM